METWEFRIRSQINLSGNEVFVVQRRRASPGQGYREIEGYSDRESAVRALKRVYEEHEAEKRIYKMRKTYIPTIITPADLGLEKKLDPVEPF